MITRNHTLQDRKSILQVPALLVQYRNEQGENWFYRVGHLDTSRKLSNAIKDSTMAPIANMTGEVSPESGRSSLTPVKPSTLNNKAKNQRKSRCCVVYSAPYQLDSIRFLVPQMVAI